MSIIASRAPPIRVLFSHDRFAVVGKPAGMVVHRNKFSRRGETALLQVVRDQLGREVYPVHRLDGGTSGCLVFAFDSPMCALLQSSMRDSARKVYLAHVRGDASWICDKVVDRAIKDDKGIVRTALTRFRCVASCDDDLPERSSLIVAEPSTGRYHQIRKHLNGLAHPILGDSKHGDSRVNRWWRAERGMRHLGLHCAELHLDIEGVGQIDVRCPVRADLISVWCELPWWEEACAALPQLRADADMAASDLALEAAAQDHSERAAAAGSGLICFSSPRPSKAQYK